MVTISLFDFQGPPEAISGEARQLSPLDVLFFTPVSAATKTGEKLTTGLLSTISKFFAQKQILPATKGLNTVTSTQIGGRTGGAPFKLSGGTTSQSINYIAPKAAANTVSGIPKFALPGFPKIPKISTSTKLLAGAGITSGFTFGSIHNLTQTEGGRDSIKDVTGVASGITNFARQNPLLLAGGLIVVGIMVLKR